MAGCVIQRGEEWSAFFVEVVHVDDWRCTSVKTVVETNLPMMGIRDRNSAFFCGHRSMEIRIGISVKFLTPREHGGQMLGLRKVEAIITLW